MGFAANVKEESGIGTVHKQNSGRSNNFQSSHYQLLHQQENSTHRGTIVEQN